MQPVKKRRILFNYDWWGFVPVQLCQSGRFILSKGDNPYTVEELKSRLESVWSLSSTWRIISLGRGFDNIHFSSQSDRDRVWNRRVWQVKPGIFVFNNGHQISILINKTHLWRGCGFTTSGVLAPTNTYGNFQGRRSSLIKDHWRYIWPFCESSGGGGSI